MNDFLVTVVCVAYNHEEYIRDALDNFAAQKTNFKFKVVVHDNASTDNTPKIIQEYAEKYPGLFFPILQKENQKRGFMRTFIQPQLEGKYFAICEGDDYWCDPNKLQEQFDFMEQHPDYVACVHNTLKYDCRTNKGTPFYENGKSRDIKLEDVVWKGGAAFHLSSLFGKKEYFLVPDEIRLLGNGDYSRAIYLTLSGKVRFLNKIMSVYRYYANGSCTARTFSKPDLNKVIQLDRNIIIMLDKLDKYSEGKYTGLFHEVMKAKEADILFKQKNIVTLLQTKITSERFSKNTAQPGRAFCLQGRCARFCNARDLLSCLR